MSRRLTAVLFAVLLAAACGGESAPASTPAPSVAQGTPSSTTATTPTTAATTLPATTTTTTAAPATTTQAGPLTYEFTVAGGVVDGPGRIEARVGDDIIIFVTADIADEVHLHGYDVFADVTPDSPARLAVVTDIPGIFEMELEGARLVLAELEVR